MQEAFAKVYSGIMRGAEVNASFRANVASASRQIAIDKARKAGDFRTEMSKTFP